ncbi:hypothetical protein BFJ63_vAg16579 [Fusarium oxysporum f. sp. narcissi]|uniref:Alpha/beta hydrolase fold-3 domain-containing protein n=2 Tax=Fusarium oxysporum TaxID=5507 RepID=A0A4Q2V1X3_FUSOX|nr:hypothetical protein FOVG_18042 [Fusarium oxysporum f. sp. pisi HDV247]RYC80542.1 hypothetical protein BFJ63_vAg16579 [Fusarium oxysporum f. sp. narcissi]
MRDQFNGLNKMLEPQYPQPTSAVNTEDGSFETIKYRIYIPVELGRDKPLPLGVYYHPGGFVIGQSMSDDVLCRAIAQQAGSIIVAVQYRLAPEHKAPSQLEDALRAVEWTHRNAARIGGDATKLYVLGASAGAGLAFCVARKFAMGQTASGPRLIKGIVALCPYTLHSKLIPEMYKLAHKSHQEHRYNVPMIDVSSMETFFNNAGLQPDDEDYFIALDRDCYRYLPPAYISTCEFDPLRDDGKIMVESLQVANIPVKTDHYDGLPHCFWVFPALPETEVFFKKTISGTRWLISQMEASE